jgi:transposase InsO family protein
VATNTLNRRFTGWLPNRAWVADLTFIATAQGWLHLAAIMNLASRRIVSWSMMQSFFKTLKVEQIYQGRDETREQARLDIVNWIERFYNRQRLQLAIGYRTSVEIENMLKAA